MAVTALGARLADAIQAGAHLDFSGSPDRPTFACSPLGARLLEPLLAPDTKPATQALLRHVGAYRMALRRLLHLTAQGPSVSQADAREALNEEWRLVDELGVALADAVLASVGREWAQSTGRCPFCGNQEHDA